MAYFIDENNDIRKLLYIMNISPLLSLEEKKMRVVAVTEMYDLNPQRSPSILQPINALQKLRHCTKF